MCMSVLPGYVYVWVPGAQEGRRGHLIPSAVISYLVGIWGLNLRPVHKQRVPLTSEPSSLP